MRKHFSYLLPLLCLVLFSCQKEAADPDMQPDPGNTDNTDSATYLPLTKGTYWRYQDSITGTITTMTVLDETKTIGGRTYTAVIGSNSQTDTFYMTRQGADYFNYAEVDNGTSSGMFLFHYLNDTAAVGRNWDYVAGQGNGFTAYFKTTIIERDITHTVNSRAYTHVIHTRMEMSYDIFGERTPVAVYDYYTARGVGIIQIKTSIDMFGVAMTSSSDLLDYQVK